MLSGSTFWSLLRALLLAALLLALLVRLFEEHYVFFPDKFGTNRWNPYEYGVQAEDVFFTTGDGVRLHAWWARAEGATHTLLYFHGNAGNLTNRIENIGFLQQLPANVLAVDYRGYGKSEGRPTEAGVYRDAESAYDYLVRDRGIPAGLVVVLGQSLGTAVAVELATRRPVAGLILEGGFPSARRVAQRLIWLPGLGHVIRSKFDSAGKLKKIHAPVLVAHCRADPVLPYELGRELFAAANEPKTFVSYAGECHEPVFLADAADYASQLRAFLESTRR